MRVVGTGHVERVVIGDRSVVSTEILKYYTVTGAIVCSRVTYSNSRYYGIIRVEESSSRDNRENICDFKRNNILDRCYRDEEGNTRGPCAPYIHRLPVSLLPTRNRSIFSILQCHSLHPLFSAHDSSARLRGFFPSYDRNSLALPCAHFFVNISATSLVLGNLIVEDTLETSLTLPCLFLLSMFRSETDRLGLPQRSPLWAHPVGTISWLTASTTTSISPTSRQTSCTAGEPQG
jgi:hypothetical protein